MGVLCASSRTHPREGERGKKIDHETARISINLPAFELQGRDALIQRIRINTMNSAQTEGITLEQDIGLQ
eukprot:scaffold421367_cov62-Attheya_sp.AAC.6